jgi:hypothetical protein
MRYYITGWQYAGICAGIAGYLIIAAHIMGGI